MTTQLERLTQDVNELDQYIKKLQKRGSDDRITKLKNKKQYLIKHIAEIQQVMQ